MFARLGILIGFLWTALAAALLGNAGNLTGENLLEIGLIPAAIVAVIGFGLTWVFSALFGE